MTDATTNGSPAKGRKHGLATKSGADLEKAVLAQCESRLERLSPQARVDVLEWMLRRERRAIAEGSAKSEPVVADPNQTGIPGI